MGVLMECGHTSQGVDAEGNPVCVIHMGIDPGATVVHTDPPDLTGRKAVCTYARGGDPDGLHTGGGQYAGRQFANGRDSAVTLAFFKHTPEQATDEFYCGCWGWD